MVSEPEVSAIVPPFSSTIRHRLPSPGSRGLVPPLHRYYAVLRFPAALPAALRCLRLAVPRLGSRFAPRRGKPACLGHGLGQPASLPALYAETTGPPRFLGVPHAHMPRSGTPMKARCQASSITRPARSLCTLRGSGYPNTTPHSVPAGGQPLPGGTPSPPGRSEGFRDASNSYISSPLPRLGLAQRIIHDPSSPGGGLKPIAAPSPRGSLPPRWRPVSGSITIDCALDQLRFSTSSS